VPPGSSIVSGGTPADEEACRALSPREREIVRLIADASGSPGIADVLSGTGSLFVTNADLRGPRRAGARSGARGFVLKSQLVDVDPAEYW
jgi:hypothetical protein